jgi:conjugal transfer/type IV secretion protein DotA/TraY
MAMGLLAPVMKGFSIFQVAMLMAIGASVNLANHIWGEGLDKIFSDGGAASLSAPEALMDDSKELSAGLLKALAIQEYFRQSLDLGVVGPLAPEAYWPPATKDAGGLLVLTMAVPKGVNLSPGDLGRLRLPCDNPESEMCRARLAAVRRLIERLAPLAEALADPKRDLSLYESGLLARAVQAYRSEVKPWLEAVRESESEKVLSGLGQFKEAARASGWVAAGAYYWNMARLNESMGKLLYSTATWSEGDPRLAGDVLEDFGVVWDRLERYQNGAFRPERAVSAESVPAEFPSAAWFGDKVSGFVGREALSAVIERLKKGDPIMVLASLGRFLVTTAESVIGLKVASTALAAAAGSSSSSLLGQAVSLFTGTLTSLMAGAALGAVEAIGPYMVVLSLLLISYGFLLAYLLPAIPFLIFLYGVLAWVVMVMEALAAAPLWVAAHALPDGDGLAGQGGRHGYLLFLGVLMRPPMMVIGFLLAMALMTGLGRVIGHMLAVFGFDRVGESFLGVSGFLAFSVIMGLCVVTAAWRLFGLAAHLPERAVSWIGAHVGGHAEVEEARRIQSGYGAAGTVSTKMIEPAAKLGGKSKP